MVSCQVFENPSIHANKHKPKRVPISVACMQTGLEYPLIYGSKGVFKHGGELQYTSTAICDNSTIAI